MHTAVQQREEGDADDDGDFITGDEVLSGDEDFEEASDDQHQYHQQYQQRQQPQPQALQPVPLPQQQQQQQQQQQRVNPFLRLGQKVPTGGAGAGGSGGVRNVFDRLSGRSPAGLQQQQRSGLMPQPSQVGPGFSAPQPLAVHPHVASAPSAPTVAGAFGRGAAVGPAGAVAQQQQQMGRGRGRGRGPAPVVKKPPPPAVRNMARELQQRLEGGECVCVRERESVCVSE